jgi:hypothetical protein
MNVFARAPATVKVPVGDPSWTCGCGLEHSPAVRECNSCHTMVLWTHACPGCGAPIAGRLGLAQKCVTCGTTS